MKKIKGKLNLKSETVKRLSGHDLSMAHGGAWTDTGRQSNLGMCSVAEDATCNCMSQRVTQCAGLCTTNPFTNLCPAPP